jgi:hypothetical protein
MNQKRPPRQGTAVYPCLFRIFKLDGDRIGSAHRLPVADGQPDDICARMIRDKGKGWGKRIIENRIALDGFLLKRPVVGDRVSVRIRASCSIKINNRIRFLINLVRARFRDRSKVRRGRGGRSTRG